MEMNWEKIMEEYKEMSLEELDSIAGGFMYEDLSDKDRKQYLSLYENYRTLCTEYSAGKASRADVDDAFQSIVVFVNKMEKKY